MPHASGSHPAPLCYWYINDEDRWHSGPTSCAAHRVRQVCLLSPTLFAIAHGIFFDGLHDSLLAWPVGVRLKGWVSSLVHTPIHANDVCTPFLDISWTAALDLWYASVLPLHGPDQSPDPYSVFRWVLIHCRLSRAGLRCLRCHDAHAGAHFVPPMLLATSAIVSLIALIFRAFGISMQGFFRILMMP